MIMRRTLVTGLGLAAASGATAHALGLFNGEGQASGTSLATPPKPFNSNNNYFMYGGGEPIRDLRVTVEVEEDLVAPQSMTFQLNVTSPENGNCIYQQYVIIIQPKPNDVLELLGMIENFPSTAFRWQLHTSSIGFPCSSGTTETDCKGNLFNYPLPRVPFATYPGLGARIPAGYKIKFDLLNDAKGRLTGAKYTAVDKTGAEQTTGPMLIRTIDYVGTTTPVGVDALAPALAFELNLVGNGGGRHTELTSGGGKIIYEASTPITPLASNANLPNIHRTGTGESSNLVYNEVPAGPQTKIVQMFLRTPGPLTPPRCPAEGVYDPTLKRCVPGNLTPPKVTPPK